MAEEITAADLRSMCIRADATETEDGSVLGQDVTRPGAEETTKDHSSDSETEATEIQDREVQDEQEKEPEEKGTKEESKEEIKDSKYTRAVKEKERFDRNWQKFEEEKKRHAEERAEWERQRVAQQDEVRREYDRVRQAEVESKARAARGEYTAADYRAAADSLDSKARELRDSGDYTESENNARLAKQAREQADRLNAEEQQALQSRNQQESVQQFVDGWYKHRDQVCAQRPEIRDNSSPIHKEVAKLLSEEEIFHRIPDGFSRAVQVAELNLKAALVPELETKIKNYEEELKRLRKATSPVPGESRTAKAKESNILDLPSKDRRKAIRSMLEERDAEVGV